ncbi:hypothetical protein [Emcibacter nanhaiensis]|uniref:Uncharacterized protein n=1 Tax=Emcibacter nanhaiensis TaxID=1505037 RepID=A0A501PKU9_9PROT|nr:hypothetical protein [Emcibacter nanhaiensis]TPD60687.1 hypothetical protein FIV46_08140 [Emcibacter nanhaiensis]
MLSKTHRLTIREQYSSAAPGNHGISRQFARRLMLSISLIAVSPEALLTGNGGQINWIERARAGNDNDAFGDLSPLKDETLEKQRGGFSVAGLEVDVGVSIKTTIDGFLEVSTNYSLDSKNGLVHLGSEIKNLAQNMTNSMIEDIQTETNAAINDSPAETSNTSASAMDPAPATLSLSGNSGYDIDNSAAAEAVPAASATVASVVPATSNQAPQAETVSADFPLNEVKTRGPELSTTETPVTTNDAAPTAATTTATTVPQTGAAESVADSDVASATVTSTPAPSSATAAESAPSVPDSMAEIIHQTSGEHITLLTNRLNNANIQQTVTLNITLENVSKIKDIARVQKDITQLARQISLFSLRH